MHISDEYNVKRALGSLNWEINHETDLKKKCDLKKTKEELKYNSQTWKSYANGCCLLGTMYVTVLFHAYAIYYTPVVLVKSILGLMTFLVIILVDSAHFVLSKGGFALMNPKFNYLKVFPLGYAARLMYFLLKKILR